MHKTPLTQQIAQITKNLLGVTNFREVSVANFDSSLLDGAKEEASKKIASAAGNWIIRLFTAMQKQFVQIQSPDHVLTYALPELAVEGKITFKQFLEQTKNI